MAYCTNCGAPLLNENMKFCSNCGAKQIPLVAPIEPQKPVEPVKTYVDPATGQNRPVQPAFVPTPRQAGQGALVTLCVLTIIGSVITLIKSFFFESIFSYEAVELLAGRSNYGYVMLSFVRYLSPLASLGTLTGAIMMLNRKRTGYTLYIVSQCIYIVLVMLRQINFYNDNTILDPVSLVWGTLYCIPAAVFIILYSRLVKKHLS